MLAGVSVLLGAFALFLRSAGPGFTLEDSTELTVSVATLSNTHPPGNPWYLLSGKLFFLLPLGSPGFRLELMSAVYGALAILAVFRLVGHVAGRAGFSRREALTGALGASAMVATSMTMWLESSITEKYAFFMALFGWSVYALCRFEELRTTRWLVPAFFLSGLAWGCHYQGIYLLIPLVWALVHGGSARNRAVAGLFFLLPVMARYLYTPLRAVTHPAINWGVPDNFSRFLEYAAFRGYQSDRFLVSGAGLPANPAELASRFFIHLLVVPFTEIGWAVLLSIAGFLVAWKWSRRLGKGILSLALLNVVVSANIRTSNYALYDLPYVWILGALAGLGVVRLSSLWRPALGAAPLIFVIGFFQFRDFSMRDRDYLASDHMRNPLMCAPADSIIVSGGAAGLLLPWYAREVAPQVRIQGLFVNALDVNDPDRGLLDRILGPGAAKLRYLQEVPAIYRTLANAAAPRPVFCEFFNISLPSTGLRWRGVLLELLPDPVPAVFDARSADLAGKLRLRGMFRPRGGQELYVARVYGIGFNAQGRAALAAGMNGEALGLARRGLLISPDLPELHDLCGRALFALGREREAGEEWRNALAAASRAGKNWFEPYLGLARLKGRDRSNDRLARLEYLRNAVLTGLGKGNGYSLSADRLRKQARFDEAEKVYHSAIAVIYDGYGKDYLSNQRIPQAARSWEDALYWNPGFAPALLGLAHIAEAEERFGDAVALYQKVLDGGPAAARQEAGAGLALVRDNERKLREFSALEAKINDSEPGPGLLCDAGNLCLDLGRARVAERLYRRSLAKAPRYPRAWNNLGSALVEQERTDEAISAYKKAVEADPGFNSALFNLANVLAGQGKFREAKVWIERALEQRPGWPEMEVLRDRIRQTEAAEK